MPGNQVAVVLELGGDGLNLLLRDFTSKHHGAKKVRIAGSVLKQKIRVGHGNPLDVFVANEP